MRLSTSALLLLGLVLGTSALNSVIKIGAIFHDGDEDFKKVFDYVIDELSVNRIPGDFILEPAIRWVNESTNSYATSKAACELLEDGAAVIFGPTSSYTKHIVSAITARHDVPHIEYSWRSIEESALPPNAVNVYPGARDITKVIAELKKVMPWQSFTAIYETDDGLARIKKALELHGPKDLPVTVRQLGEGPDYRSLLKEIAATREANIILDVESEHVIDVIRQATEIRLAENYHNYIITDLDLPSHPFSSTFTNLRSNITGFALLTGELPAELDLPTKVPVALLHDALYLFHNALRALNVYNQDIDDPIDIVPESLQCGEDRKYVAGPNLTAFIRKERRVNRLTGPMRISENGERESFDLSVTEFQVANFVTTGQWHDGQLVFTRSTEDQKKAIEEKISGHHFLVTTRVQAPYFMEVKGESNHSVAIGDKKYEGFSVHLIDEISKLLGFNFTFELVPDGKYGAYDPETKSWNGLMQRLRNHEADLAICDLTITHQREQVVDFTMPFMTLGISILYAKPEIKPPNLFSFLSPFTTEVWIYVATAYLGVSIMLFVQARITPSEWDNPHPCNPDPEELENQFNLMNSLWLTIGSLMQQGSDLLPKAPSIRMIAALWWFFVLIMASSYTANLAAFLTTGKNQIFIKSAEDLAEQSKIKYGAVDGGSTSSFFKDSNNSVYKRMWESMIDTRPSVFTKTNDEGVDRVSKGKHRYAFLMESTAIDYAVARDCTLKQVGGLLDSKGYGIAMPLNSAYRTEVSGAVLRLQEKGTLEILKTYWWQKKDNDTNKCEDDGVKANDEGELGMAEVGGVFLVLMLGCAISTIVAILEFLWNVRKVAVEEKITPWEAFKAELKFALNIWAETKPVKIAQSSNNSSSEGGGIGRAASVARSMVGSFLRLDILDKFDKDNTSNNRSDNRRIN